MIGQNESQDLTYKVKLPNHPRILELLNIIRTEHVLIDGDMYVQEHKGPSTENIISNILSNRHLTYP